MKKGKIILFIFIIIIIFGFFVFLKLKYFSPNWTEADTRKLAQEIKNQNLAFCENLPEKGKMDNLGLHYLYAQSACYSIIADLKNDPSVCNKIPKTGYPQLTFGYSERAGCFVRFADASKDSSICGLANEQVDKDDCYYFFNLNSENNPTLCDSIKENEYDYIRCYAYTSKGKLCAGLMFGGVNVENKCYRELFKQNLVDYFSNFDIKQEVCDKLETNQESEVCRYFFAAASKNIDDCKPPPETLNTYYNHPDTCYLVKALVNSDIEICDYIMNKISEERCKERISAKKQINNNPSTNKFKSIIHDGENNKLINLSRFEYTSDL